MVEGTAKPGRQSTLVWALAVSMLVLIGVSLLELIQFGAAGGGLYLSVSVWVVFLLLALTLPLSLLLILSCQVLALRGRALWLCVAGTASVAALPVALDLSHGAGIQRSNMQALVVVGVPLLAALFMVGALFALRRLSARRLGLPATMAVLAAIVCRECSRRFLVGLYPSIHDAAFVIELMLWLTAVALITRGRFVSRKSLFVVSIGVVVGSLAWIRAPEEAERATFSRDGFHARRVLRWRGHLLGRPTVKTPTADPVLVEQVKGWREVALGASERLQALRAQKKPLSLLWVTIDTLRADRLTKELTPNLFELAERSGRFTTVYSQFPATHFSFGSMFHGRYPSATAFFRSLNGSEDKGLSLNEAFRGSGFRTGASIGFTNEWLETPGFRWLLRHFEFVNHEREGFPSYAGEHFVNSATSTLDQMKGDRFFYWLHLMDPHHDYVHHEGLTQGEELVQRYEGEIRYADQQLGRMLRYLDESGLRDSTVVVVNADHGEALGEHGGTYYHATSLLEEQLRVPLVIHIPGVAPMTSDVNVECVDLAETFQDILRPERRFLTQGTSLLPLMLDVESERLWPDFAHSELPKTGNLTVVPPASMLRVGTEKIIVHEEEGYIEFFDLAEDPNELNDVSAQRPQRRLELVAMLRGLQEWSHRFDRGVDPDEQRQQFIEEARDQIEDVGQPLRRQQGLLLAHRAQLIELASLIENLGLNRDAVPELRIEALRVLKSLDEARTSNIARDFAASDNDVLRWIALLEGELSGIPDHSWGTRRFEEWSRICRLPQGTRGWDGMTLSSRKTIVRPLASISRRVHARRQLIRAARSNDEIRALSRFIQDDIRLPMSIEDELLWLETLWEHDKCIWLDRAVDLVSDRYLNAALKNQILSRFNEIPKIACEELSLRMLTGFERGFQIRVREVASDILGSSRVDDLIEDQRHLNAIYEDRRAGRFEQALLGYENLILRNSGSVGVALRLAAEQVRLLLTVNHDRADLVMAQVQPMARDLSSGPHAEWYRTPLLELATLRLYRSQDGPLPASSNIRVSGVDVLGGRVFAAGSSCHAWIDIENHCDRPLPKGSSRMRVLWTRKGVGGDPQYGTEIRLPRDLAAGAAGRVHMRLTVPASAGSWVGRFILSQQNFNRFHVVEDSAGLIDLTVVSADAVVLPAQFDGGALLNRWTTTGLLRDIDCNEDRVLSWISTGYEQGITGPLIQLGSKGAECVVRCAVDSPLEGARSVVLFLTQEGTKGRKLAGHGLLSVVDGFQDVVVRIRREDFPSGRYLPQLIVGARPGVTRLENVSFR